MINNQSIERNIDRSADKQLTDLSFESLNPINNSFTAGQMDL